MSGSLGATIQAANEALIVAGDDRSTHTFFGPGYVLHGTDSEWTTGPEALRSFVGMLHKAFSNLEATIEILMETEDRVAWVRTASGTQSGSFMGFPATGRQIVWRDMVVSRFRDGLIVEDWVVTDLAERLLRARKGSRA